jgi:hypothetical protein
MLPVQARKHDPWMLLLASSAAYLASYVGREVARARLGGGAPDPRLAQGSVARAVKGAIFGGYNGTVAAAPKPSNGKTFGLRWDATLDRLTCSRCRALNGTVRKVWESPPPLHNNCCCVLHVVEMPTH